MVLEGLLVGHRGKASFGAWVEVLFSSGFRPIILIILRVLGGEGFYGRE